MKSHAAILISVPVVQGQHIPYEAQDMAATQLPPPAGVKNMSAEEVKEYEKILKISEDIFSGTHPRLKVPQQFVRKAASNSQPASVTPQNDAGAQANSPNKAVSQQAALTAKPAVSPNADTRNGRSSAMAARFAPKSASEIDPIFLEKSEDLVKAEAQLQRQRLERDIREQVETKKQESKQKVSIQDVTPDFDVSEVLSRALELVKPFAGPEAPRPKASSDSFDENSFYSSRAPDSPQHGDHRKPSSASSFVPDEHGNRVAGEKYPDELHRLEALNRPDSDQSMQDAYSVADPRITSQRQSHYPEAHRGQHPRQHLDHIDEPEYSPPAPGVAPMEREEDDYEPEPPRPYPRGPKRRSFDPRDRYARRSISPAEGVRVVRNHITSPAAPQPSRVSPLAMSKVPSVNQLQDSRGEYDPERRVTPEVPTQPIVSRKRRRLLDDRNRSRQGYRAQAGGSAKSFIKQEPVSPPPFADTPPIYRARAPQEGPVYIDIPSPRYTPVIERREPILRTSTYGPDPYYEAHSDAGIQRTGSQLGSQRLIRDDQDLRRVASLHQARKPEWTREPIDQQSPHSARNGPYAIVERPPEQESARYNEEQGVPPPRQYASPIPQQMTDPYYHNYVVEPPPRRIVIDENGNQYYESLPAPRAQAMPPPASRVPRADVYEAPPQMRHASVRAVSVAEDPYGARRYVQEMPQATYRRVTDYARPPPAERRPYAAQFETREPYPGSGPSGSVQNHDFAAQPSHYPEEAQLPRERIVRIPNSRPPTTRYQEPREMMQRESVYPGARDASVYVDDDLRHPREYIERPMYIATRPMAREERYYNNGEPERVVLDGSRDVIHRVPQHY